MKRGEEDGIADGVVSGRRLKLNLQAIPESYAKRDNHVNSVSSRTR